MLRRSLMVLAMLIVQLAGCRDPEKERIQKTTEATYDSKTGRLTRVTADFNKDGVIDTYTYTDGAKVLRTEIDADQDGKIEKWEFHGDDGKVARVAMSRGKNGKPDAWMYPGPDGKPARAEISSTQDEKRIDRREWYEDGQLARAEEDATRDGTVDKWEVWRAGSLATITFDENGDGSPDRRLVYGEGGRLLAIETQPDGRGGFKRRTAGGS